MIIQEEDLPYVGQHRRCSGVRPLAAGADDRQHGDGIARKQRASGSDRFENRLKHFVKPTFEVHVAKATLAVALLESLDFLAPRIKRFEVGKDHVSFYASRIAGAHMSRVGKHRAHLGFEPGTSVPWVGTSAPLSQLLCARHAS